MRLPVAPRVASRVTALQSGALSPAWSRVETVFDSFAHGDEDGEGVWRTINGAHIHFNESGEPDKGPADVVQNLQEEGKSKSGKIEGNGDGTSEAHTAKAAQPAANSASTASPTASPADAPASAPASTPSRPQPLTRPALEMMLGDSPTYKAWGGRTLMNAAQSCGVGETVFAPRYTSDDLKAIAARVDAAHLTDADWDDYAQSESEKDALATRAGRAWTTACHEQDAEIQKQHGDNDNKSDTGDTGDTGAADIHASVNGSFAQDMSADALLSDFRQNPSYTPQVENFLQQIVRVEHAELPGTPAEMHRVLSDALHRHATAPVPQNDLLQATKDAVAAFCQKRGLAQSKWAKQHYQENAPLKDSEKEALGNWAYHSRKVATALRNGDTRTHAAQIAALDTATANGSITAPTPLFRGVTGAAATHFQNMQPGDEVSDASFMATSLAAKRALPQSGEGVLMVIHASAGQKGAYLDNSVEGHPERELLLPRNTRLRLVRTEETPAKDADGRAQTVQHFEVVAGGESTAADTQSVVADAESKPEAGNAAGAGDINGTNASPKDNPVCEDWDGTGLTITPKADKKDKKDKDADAEKANGDATTHTAASVAEAASAAHPSPSPAQLAANNHRRGHLTLHGIPIAIEHPAGSVRRGIDRNGTEWERPMSAHYGYVKGTSGSDGDPVDVFIGPHPESESVYVIDQVHLGTGQFDEHKAVLGTQTPGDAVRLYLSHYPTGWKGMGAVTPLSVDAFRDFCQSPQRARHPLSLPYTRRDPLPGEPT